MQAHKIDCDKTSSSWFAAVPGKEDMPDGCGQTF